MDTNTSVSYAGATDTLYGRYCAPTNGSNSIVVAVPGATYNHEYWSGLGGSTDIQQSLAASGHASIAIDRLGHGRSTHVSSVGLSADDEADAIHQLITALRGGSIDHTAYHQVALLGHSLGSGISVVEATRHPGDIDQLILTGWNDGLSPDVLANVLLTGLVPASLDPRVHSVVGADPTALTTRAGQRQSLFGDKGVPAAVASADERNKDWVGVNEITTAVLEGISNLHTHEITVPTLVVDGTDDPVFCRGLLQHRCDNAATLQRDLAGSFAPEAHLTTALLSHAGHCIQLEPTAPDYNRAITDWLRQRNNSHG